MSETETAGRSFSGHNLSYGYSLIHPPLSLVGGAVAIAEYANSVHHPVLPFAIIGLYTKTFDVVSYTACMYCCVFDYHSSPPVEC